ncbi:sigma-70 family RNA polymerase sigma factor [Sphingobium sp. TB-6]|uniref:RNA polymerase sigma factor n=1 Tax=Sphingobium sp. TB-6 TaxID=2728850 RepID=UPI000B3C67A5|nr:MULTISPECIES: sigma-70 family RNA polymerase sigma factor [Sphingomonadaceae]NML87482.1 sigma-70 family RNA polymerase sigma factor [Sphingobium sp. TB-6]
METVGKAGRTEASAHARAEEDLYLLARVKRRDLKAFEALYRHYQPRLARFLTNILRRPHLVEEVLDDTLLVLWDRPDSFSGRSKLSTWLFTIGWRKAMKALRKQDDPVEDRFIEERINPDRSPEQCAGDNRIRAALLQALANLSPEQRAVVDLSYFHEIGYRDIAEIMDCPVDTVKTRMFHARRHLRRALPGDFGDWI